jgi:hypothetical protein
MTGLKKISFIVLVCIICVSCSSYRMEKVQIEPPFEYGFIKAVAVIDFSNSTNRNGAGKILADRVEQLLLEESGYKVLNRMDIDKILREKNLEAKGMLGPSAAMEIGKFLGVDALILGNVENYGLRYEGKTRRVGVALTFKVLKTENGRVLWSKTTHGEYRTKDKLESDFECFEKAINVVLKDVKFLFPHEKEEYVPTSGGAKFKNL